MKLPCVAAICVLAFAVGVLLNPGPLRAEDVVLSDAEKAKFTENILLPSPGEVFLALQRAGNDKADWIGAASFCPTYDYDNDYLHNGDNNERTLRVYAARSAFRRLRRSPQIV